MGGLVSTPLPSEKVCDVIYVDGAVWKIQFQHLYLLGRSATLLPPVGEVNLPNVSTPLPSGKVCDTGRKLLLPPQIGFQHLYLLGRSATFMLK